MDDTAGRVGDNSYDDRRVEEVRARADESLRGTGTTGEHDLSVADPEADRRATQIQREIEQTRDEMSETIDAIQEKLRPANIVSSATDKIKHATTERVREMTHSAGQAANKVMYGDRYRSGGLLGAIRDNPFPAALFGIGAAWWLMGSRGHEMPYDGDDDYNRYDSRAPSNTMSRREYGDSGWQQASGRSGLMERVRNNPLPATLAGIGLGWLAFADVGEESDDRWRGSTSNRYARSDAAGEDTLHRVSAGVSGAASDVADTAQELTDRAQEYTREAGRRARQTGQRAQNELQRLTMENPLAVGAGALLLGAIVGLAVPETERENEMLGETRDSVLDKAQEMAQTATARAQDAAADLVSDAARTIVSGKKE